MDGAMRSGAVEVAVTQRTGGGSAANRQAPRCGAPCSCARFRKGRLLGGSRVRGPSPMEVRRITKSDFDRIVEVIDHWWGGPIGTFVHPIFFYELGGPALVVEQDSEMIGFLLGFFVHGFDPPPAAGSAGPRTGYVHLVGIHPDFRRRGVG